MGLYEPDPASREIAPARIGLAVIPCVSCSHDGRRLGHGGGYYDRYFSENRQIPGVIICREALMTQNIPTEDHDLRFPMVISEAGIFCTSGEM